MEIIIDTLKPFKDNLNDDAPIINKAIENVSLAGGGKVIISKGKYKASTIIFKDNVELHLEKDSKITLFDDLSKFKTVNRFRDESINRPTWENCDYDGMPTKFFIYANGCKNISITGEGVIDGNEEIFYGTITKWHIEGSYYPRIPLIFFENSRNIKLNGITLTRSAFWTVHLVGDQYVDIENITIDNNLKLTNCDGIDPDHSKHVNIKNCNISCADDCVVIKTTKGGVKYGECEDINVSNCTFKSTSAAIKIGTESCSDFKNIHFENIDIISSNRGISLMLRDEGNINDCSFKNINMDLRLFSKIHWWGSDEGIAITAVPREDKVGKISNLLFENININSENGLLIYGNDNISNITLKNIDLTINKKTDYPHENLDLRPGKFGIIESKFYALTVVGANDITFDSFNVKKDCDYIDELYNISKAKNINFKNTTI